MKTTTLTHDQIIEKLIHILEGQKEFLIVTHNNPDPDAIAAALSLGYLAQQLCKINFSIAYGGNIGRSENQVMVKKLKIKLKRIKQIRFEKYERIALVDTQPDSGNHSLLPDSPCHIVVDHHPIRKHHPIELFVVQPDVGVTTTMLIEWLHARQIPIPANLATAMSYAMISETQYLGRESTKRDIRAYLSIYPKSNIRTLAEIIRPKLPQSYFSILSKALGRAVTYRNLACIHLGDVDAPEIISEMADFILRRQQLSWSMCTGRFKQNLIISIRSSNQKAKAHDVIKHLVLNPQDGGGHEMIAGGFIPLANNRKEELANVENRLSEQFAHLLGYDQPDWKPLVE
ncbi:DHH family phosphoesterase [candidate division KSB1 bacterium]|nr:DHH family phosphoesterase [candidate division KSB1 bacterium]